LLFNLDSLTPGEIFHLWIRQNKFSEKNVADMYHVSDRTIRNWEKDRCKSVPDVRSDVVLTPYLCCYILRRRIGLTCKQFAPTLDVDENKVYLWENGGGDWQRLVDYYNSLGWEFE